MTQFDNLSQGEFQPNVSPAMNFSTGFNQPVAPDTGTSNISASDLDKLFHAVTKRLESCVGGRPAQPTMAHMLGTTAIVQTAVLECVADLNQLHLAWMRTRQLPKND